jgi:hypothetical protein
MSRTLFDPTPRFRAFLLACMCLLIAGCTGGCAVTPETPEEGVAAAYSTIESVAETIATARDAGYLEQAEVERLADRLQQAKDLTDTARRAIADGRATEGESILKRVRTVLAGVKQTIEEKGYGPDTGHRGAAGAGGGVECGVGHRRERGGVHGGSADGALRGPDADGCGAAGVRGPGAGGDRRPPSLIG